MAQPSFAAGVDLSHTSALLQQGSPKGMYTYFLLACAKNYFERLSSGADNIDIEGATLALIAFCPNRAKREELWDFYKVRKETTKDTQYSSVHTIGELISYLSEMLEFEEQSNAGIL